MIPYKDFMLAGRAVFTLTGQDGKHFTYRVNKSKKWTTPRWSVALGISYEGSMYMGYLTADLVLRQDGYSRVSRHVPSWQLLAEFLFWEDYIASSNPIRFQHEGKCCVCGRPLTHPQSIEDGIGPECSGRGYNRVDDLSEFLPKGEL